MLAASRAALSADGFDALLSLLEATEPDLTALESPLTVLLSCPPRPPHHFHDQTLGHTHQMAFVVWGNVTK